MAVKIVPARYKQAPCLRLENEALRLLVLPGRGGNIASLFDKRADRELLYQRPGDVLRPVPRGLRFEDAECAGIDDMFPNAAAAAVETVDGGGSACRTTGRSGTGLCARGGWRTA